MEKPKYEQIWSIQQAINTAVAEKRVVRFLSDKTNAELKKRIEDIKGCKLLKPDKTSNDIAVIPPSVDSFDFEEVDMSSEIWLPKDFKR